MLLRASLGMAIVISLMGCVTSVYQLVALRLLQGIFLVISVMPLPLSQLGRQKKKVVKFLEP